MLNGQVDVISPVRIRQLLSCFLESDNHDILEEDNDRADDLLLEVMVAEMSFLDALAHHL
jgi:hypothetical protein